MKKLLFILTLALTPYLLGASYGYGSLKGKWKNDYHTIKIKKIRHGIKVKGLSHRNKWVKFKENRRGKLKDCYGNTIRVINRNVIVYKNKRRGYREKFYRAKRHGNYGHPLDCSASCCAFDNYGGNHGRDYNDYYDNRWNDRWDDRWGSTDYNDDYIYSDGRFDNGYFGRDIAGTYYSDKLRKDVRIERTDKGIRAKLSGDDKWYYYDRDRFNNRSFKDKKGNTYTIMSNGSLKWKGKKNYKSYELRRVS